MIGGNHVTCSAKSTVSFACRGGSSGADAWCTDGFISAGEGAGAVPWRRLRQWRRYRPWRAAVGVRHCAGRAGLSVLSAGLLSAAALLLPLLDQPSFVMAGRDPAIPEASRDPRVKPGDDGLG